MTVSETTEYIKTRLELLGTDITHNTSRGTFIKSLVALMTGTQSVKDDINDLIDTLIGTAETSTLIGKVWHGTYEDPPMGSKTVASIQAESETDTLSMAGGTMIPQSPYSVPIYVTLYVKGQKNDAYPTLYDLVRTVLTDLSQDMTMGGTCTEAYFPEDRHVLYSQLENQTGFLAAAGTIIIIANYSN